jgi:hypothetical protein
MCIYTIISEQFHKPDWIFLQGISGPQVMFFMSLHPTKKAIYGDGVIVLENTP